jgi:HK97 family phage major capsid protein
MAGYYDEEQSETVIKLPIQTREASYEGSSKDTNLIHFVFASENPVQRPFGLEILSFEPGACDCERLSAGVVPLLFNHDYERAIGQLVSYRIGTTHPRKAYGVAKLGSSALAQETLRDMQSGTRPGLSVGYLIKSMRLLKAGEGDELDTYVVTRWIPVEISTIPIPADPSCRITRSLDDGRLYDAIIENPLATRFLPPSQESMLPPSESTSPFRTRENASPRLIKTVEENYSLARVLTMGSAQVDGFEREVHQALAREKQLDHSGIFVPFEILCRDLSVTGGIAAGGAMVGTDVQKNVLDSLRPYSAVLGAGAQLLSNLTGNFSQPRRKTFIPDGWQTGENTIPSLTGPTFDSLTLSPLRIAIESRVSKQLLAQAENRGIEQYLIDSIKRDIGATLDAAALTGSGSGGVPLGILNMSENTGGPPFDWSKLAPGVTYGSGGATWTAVLDQRYHVEESNVQNDDLSMSYISSPRAKRFLSNVPILPNFPKYIWGDDNRIAGCPAYQTSNLASTDQMVFGKWSDFIFCLWTMDVVANPYTSAGSNMVDLTINCLVNCAPLRGISFCRSGDSAAGP